MEDDVDPLFSRMTQRHTPKMNDDVMNGLAVKAMANIEEFIDAQIRSIFVGMPRQLRYVGYERCSVEEEYDYATRLTNARRYFELAPTSRYLVKYLFEYTDGAGKIEQHFKYIYLPYCREAGILNIAATEMHLIPVLSDKVFTPSGDSIFVRLAQDLNNFFRFYHTVMIDGKRQSKYVAHAEIYRGSDKKASKSSVNRVRTVLPHYLYARYGLCGAFQRYYGFEPVIGHATTITPELYPPEDWVIFSATGNSPKKLPKGAYYSPTRIRLAIPRPRVTLEVENMVAGMFYVIDHFPQRFELHRNADSFQPAELNKKLAEVLNDRALWMILIGVIRIDASYPESLLYSGIAEHFETIEPYLDQVAKTKLGEKGIFLENYFDLLHHIQAKFNDYILENERNGLCVYGKNMEILHYVCYDILKPFTMMKFALSKAAARAERNAAKEGIVGAQGFITSRDVEEALRRTLKTGAMFLLQKGNRIVCEVVGYGGDHIYPKITAVVALQESSPNGERSGQQRVVPGRDHWIEPSMIFAGSMLNLPKSKPTPLVRVNPWITLDQNNTVIPNPKFEELVKKNQDLFKH